jgi:hypothetical protein
MSYAQRASNAATGTVSENRQNAFWPAEEQSMRIMFHSCNGFSVGTDMDAWVGPNLWNDVHLVIEVMVSSFVWVRNHSPRLERTIHTNTIVVDHAC